MNIGIGSKFWKNDSGFGLVGGETSKHVTSSSASSLPQLAQPQQDYQFLRGRFGVIATATLPDENSIGNTVDMLARNREFSHMSLMNSVVSHTGTNSFHRWKLSLVNRGFRACVMGAKGKFDLNYEALLEDASFVSRIANLKIDYSHVQSSEDDEILKMLLRKMPNFTFLIQSCIRFMSLNDLVKIERLINIHAMSNPSIAANAIEIFESAQVFEYNLNHLDEAFKSKKRDIAEYILGKIEKSVLAARETRSAISLLLDNSIKVFESAVETGEIGILERMRKMNFRWDEKTLYASARRGDMAMTQWLVKNGCPKGPFLLAHATNADTLDVFDWLQIICSDEQSIMSFAIKSGKIGTVKELIRRGYAFDDACFNNAISINNHEIMTCLKFNRCPFTETSPTIASIKGTMDTIRWLHINGCPMTMREVATARTAGRTVVAYFIEGIIRSSSKTTTTSLSTSTDDDDDRMRLLNGTKISGSGSGSDDDDSSDEDDSSSQSSYSDSSTSDESVKVIRLR